MTSFIPSYDKNRVMVGVAAPYVAPYSESSPPVMPLDSVALGTLWSAPWVALGGTQEGVTLRIERNTVEHRIEEQATPVIVMSDTMNITVSVVLAQDTLESLRIAAGGGTITTVAPGSGIIGKKSLDISTDLENFALGLEMKNSFGFWRRIRMLHVVSIAAVEVGHRRAAALRTYATTFHCLTKPEDVDIVEMTAAALP